MLPSTVYTMCPIHLQSLKLMCINNLGDAFKRKNNIWPLTLTLGVKVAQIIAQYPRHHMNYAPTKCEVALYNFLRGDAFTFFDLGHKNHRPVPSSSCDLSTCKVWIYYDQQLKRDTITRYVTDGTCFMELTLLSSLGLICSRHMHETWFRSRLTDRRTNGRTVQNYMPPQIK